ncbi:hypothetical protein H4R33_001503 [Dimargaris cristalligena]|uniref:Outer membrane protein TOM13-domain-containing protein n=1 Tax=Dimargaris cristalligena TaxID=215637 RepID=A0A4P9ZQZ0_9FUNG|nr:hypothetical protein H4R33_001503 [Dimargaris cristalligena]RKP35151.1 hypothetical protein BJ085DRAFT_28466 [Dimargaris cristalligena]|eukprot:RKP35151.1 hypothetical protein BJ085DRAFT_28466 [Dimargaris cristalligena]
MSDAPPPSSLFETIHHLNPSESDLDEFSPLSYSQAETINTEFTDHAPPTLFEHSHTSSGPAFSTHGSDSEEEHSPWTHPSDEWSSVLRRNQAEARPQPNTGVLGRRWTSWAAWSPFFAYTFRLSLSYLVIPFFQGVMLGFGEICANELAFLWGWKNANIMFPQLRPRLQKSTKSK